MKLSIEPRPAHAASIINGTFATPDEKGGWAYTAVPGWQNDNGDVGDTYTLSWDYGDRAGGGPQELNVSANSTLLATDSYDGTSPAGWSFNSYKFIAPLSGIEDFTFASVAVGGNPSYGNELTNVALAVPEPATWAMMLLGVGMIGRGLRLARRKSSPSLSIA